MDMGNSMSTITNMMHSHHCWSKNSILGNTHHSNVVFKLITTTKDELRKGNVGDFQIRQCTAKFSRGGSWT